jgi:hypothetical protein
MAEVAVEVKTGKVKAEGFTVVADVGKINVSGSVNLCLTWRYGNAPFSGSFPLRRIVPSDGPFLNNEE